MFIHILQEAKLMVRNGKNILGCLFAHVLLGTLAHLVEQRLQFSVTQTFVYQVAMMFRKTSQNHRIIEPFSLEKTFKVIKTNC